MKHVLPFVLALALAAPAVAQQTTPMPPETEATPEAAPEGDIGEGLSLLEEGARLLFRGLVQEMEPALDEMARGMDQLARDFVPMIERLAEMMGDVTEYHAPEMLPNGDIIIRRRQPGEAGAGEAPGDIEI